MSEPIAIIADKDRTKVEVIAKFVADRYGLRTFQAFSLDDLYTQIEDKSKRYSAINVILFEGISDNLNNAVAALLLVRRNFNVRALLAIAETQSSRTVTQNNHSDRRLSVSLATSRRGVKKAVREGLNDLRIDPVRLPAVTWDKSDLILHAQLSRLQVPSKDDKSIVRCLGHFLKKFWPNWKSARISRVTQGYSGSLVIRVEESQKAGAPGFIMKVAKANEFRPEWEGHWPRISDSLNRMKMRAFRPDLYAVDPNSPVAIIDGYSVEVWVDVGRPHTDVVDLQEAYQKYDSLAGTPAPEASGEILLAEQVVKRHFNVLTTAWYSRAIQDRGLLWKSSNNHTDTKPVYSLSLSQKARILGYFEMQQRLLSNYDRAWREHARAICKWVRDGPEYGSGPDKSRRLVYSEIHGDLNRNNLRYWLEQDQPVLIDFVTYQPKGHLVCDFASVEADIKYALLDTEKGCRALGLDLTGDRLHLWCEGESYLLRSLKEPRTRGVLAPSLASDPSLVRVVRFIGAVRQQARDAYDPKGDAFNLEYSAALLYRSLHYLFYDGISPYKRILAVHSCAQLVRLLNASV